MTRPTILVLAVLAAGCGETQPIISSRPDSRVTDALESATETLKQTTKYLEDALQLAEEARADSRKNLELARTFGKQRDEAEARYVQLANACIIQWEAQDETKEQAQHDEWSGKAQEKWRPLNIDFTPRPRYVVEPTWNPVPSPSEARDE